jgi:hypothetical protein
MADDELASQQIPGAAPTGDRSLKRGNELELFFHASLTRLITKKFGVPPSLIWSYKLDELDEDTRSDLKAKVTTAMAYPEDTGAYGLAMELSESPTEATALRFVELEGLLVLGILGEKEIIPRLLGRLKDRPVNLGARTIAGTILRRLTGQDIGGYVLSNEDIALWEQWWGDNKPVSASE